MEDAPGSQDLQALCGTRFARRPDLQDDEALMLRSPTSRFTLLLTLAVSLGTLAGAQV